MSESLEFVSGVGKDIKKSFKKKLTEHKIDIKIDKFLSERDEHEKDLILIDLLRAFEHSEDAEDFVRVALWEMKLNGWDTSQRLSEWRK